MTTNGPAPEYSDSLKEVCTVTNRELPQPQGVEKFLNKIGMSIIIQVFILPHLAAIIDGCLLFNADFYRKEHTQSSSALSLGKQMVIDTSASPAKTLMDAPQISEIKKGVDTFMEAVPVLMDALDMVTDVHPFIRGTGSPLL